MKPIWLESYPEQVSQDAMIDEYRSLVGLFESSCQKYADKKAFTNLGSSLTYAELDRLSHQFAAYLQQVCGFEKGDRFAIMMPNVLQYIVVLFGVLRAGLIVVNINPLYTSRELTQQLHDSGAKGICILENFAHTLVRSLPDRSPELGPLTIVTSAVGDLFSVTKRWIVNFTVRYLKRLVPKYSLPNKIQFNAALELGAACHLKNIEINPEDVAFLQYTGGTTGQPKAAMLTHRNFVANVQQSLTLADGAIRVGKEILISPLPLYHIFSLTLCSFAFIQTGNEVVLITNPRDITRLIKTMTKTPWTAIAGINTLYNALLHHPKFDRIDKSHIRLCIAGGAATSMVVAREWQRRTGVPILEGYGLTETSPVVTINPFNITEHTGSIGLPIPNTLIDLRDEHDNSVGVGEIGELCVKGPQVMKGYWQAPEQTSEVIDQDGWFYTGDMARMDERGFLYLIDRKKEMVLVSGFNVYPSEIKQVLMEHSGILEACVLGVEDERTGEALKAVIVKKDSKLSEENVRDYCAQNLTNYKRPKYIEFVKELPKTPVGKVLRRQLREQHFAKQRIAAMHHESAISERIE